MFLKLKINLLLGLGLGAQALYVFRCMPRMMSLRVLLQVEPDTVNGNHSL